MANEKPMGSARKFRVSVLGLREDNIEDCRLRDFGTREFNRAHHFSQLPVGMNFGKQTASVLKQKRNNNNREKINLLTEVSVGRISRQGGDNTGLWQRASINLRLGGVTAE